MSAYAQPVSIRKLFAILIALAVLIAPSVTYAAMPVAAAPHHDMRMMDMGHCQMLPSKSNDHDKTDGKSCCMSMCMAVAVAPFTPADAVEPKHSVAYFAVSQSWHGYLGEIATPPPRAA
jgi:hypothetical protein